MFPVNVKHGCIFTEIVALEISVIQSYADIVYTTIHAVEYDTSKLDVVVD